MIAGAALILAIFALLFCVYLLLEVRRKLSSEDVGSKLSQYSDELKTSYARTMKEIETEWENMFSKFSRLAGRVDKTRALDNPDRTSEPVPPATRSDLLRKHRGGL